MKAFFCPRDLALARLAAVALKFSINGHCVKGDNTQDDLTVDVGKWEFLRKFLKFFYFFCKLLQTNAF